MTYGRRSTEFSLTVKIVRGPVHVADMCIDQYVTQN
jgi:hypothetical protein